MTRLLHTGRYMFLAGIVALAALCIVNKDFIIGRPPAWNFYSSLNPGISQLAAVVIMLCAIAILFHKKATIAALIIATLILLLSVTRDLPHFTNDWLNGCKALALVGSALIVAASFNSDNITASKYMLFSGTVLLAVFLIACGYAHFKFADFVKAFIPSYIPFHAFFTYFTAVSLIAGGIGILIPATKKMAALLTGVMLTGWFLLLHIPRFIGNTNDAGDRMGLCESFAFAGIFFALAAITSQKPNQ